MSNYTEDHLVEQPAIQLMEHELGWDSVNAYDEWASGTSTLGRDGKREVVLTGRLRAALHRLNPELPVEAIEGAVEELRRNDSGNGILGPTFSICSQDLNWSFVEFRDHPPDPEP